VALACFAEAIGLARALDDKWRLSQSLAALTQGAVVAGDPFAAHAVAEEGRDLADALGDGFNSRQCRFCLASAQTTRGDLADGVTELGAMAAEAAAAHDEIWRVFSLGGQAVALTYQGDTAAAQAAAQLAVERGTELAGRFAVYGHVLLAFAALSAGDTVAAREVRGATWQQMNVSGGATAQMRAVVNAKAALLEGDLTAARQCADEAVATTTGFYLVWSLTDRTRVAIAAGELEQAEQDAHRALSNAAEIHAFLAIPDVLECLAILAGAAESHREAVRLFGAAHAIRQEMGAVRLKIYDAACDSSIASLRNAMGQEDFDSAWAEGTSLSRQDAIAYAQRGRGERKRPTSGWASLTPAERDVVRLVGEGLANNEIAARLFISPRTVQTHLTHIYTKLGLTSRVHLIQEVARHN
jgi:DNA-binding CsgD family transcriptional regulator